MEQALQRNSRKVVKQKEFLMIFKILQFKSIFCIPWYFPASLTYNVGKLFINNNGDASTNFKLSKYNADIQQFDVIEVFDGESGSLVTCNNTQDIWIRGDEYLQKSPPLPSSYHIFILTIMLQANHWTFPPVGLRETVWRSLRIITPATWSPSSWLSPCLSSSVSPSALSPSGNITRSQSQSQFQSQFQFQFQLLYKYKYN